VQLCSNCRNANDLGARFCAACGTALPLAAVRKAALLGGSSIRAATSSCVPLAQHFRQAGHIRHFRWATAGARTTLFVEGSSSQVFELLAAPGQGYQVEALGGAWPSMDEWVAPPLCTPLATVVAAADRVRWARGRRLLPRDRPLERRMGRGETVVGLGIADAVWVLLARLGPQGELRVEAGSGDGDGFLPLFRLTGRFAGGQAVFLGGGGWLDEIPDAGGMGLPSETGVVVEAAAHRLPLGRVWLATGGRFFVVDLAAGRLLLEARWSDRGLPAAFADRAEMGALEPVSVDGRHGSGGLYVSRLAEDGRPQHGFVPAGNPGRFMPLPLDAADSGAAARGVCIAALADGSGALLIDTEKVTRYAGADPRESWPHGLTRNFLPAVGNGWFAALATPAHATEGSGPDGRPQSLLRLFRFADGSGDRHVDVPLDGEAWLSLPPLLRDGTLLVLTDPAGAANTYVLPVLETGA
jgi:hypothetical protein